MKQDPAPVWPAHTGPDLSADRGVERTPARVDGTATTTPSSCVESMRWLWERVPEPDLTPTLRLHRSLVLLTAAVEDTILFADLTDSPKRKDVQAAAMKAADEANESHDWKAAEDELSGRMPKAEDFAYETRLLISTIWAGLYDCWERRPVRPSVGVLFEWKFSLEHRVRALQAMREPRVGATPPPAKPPMPPTAASSPVGGTGTPADGHATNANEVPTAGGQQPAPASPPAHPNAIALTPDHDAVLECLAKTPTKCQKVNEVSTHSAIRNRETAGRLLRELAGFGLVCQPHGKRKGYVLTPEGRKHAPKPSPT